jgi:hypothetical protein
MFVNLGERERERDAWIASIQLDSVAEIIDQPHERKPGELVVSVMDQSDAHYQSHALQECDARVRSIGANKMVELSQEGHELRMAAFDPYTFTAL